MSKTSSRPGPATLRAEKSSLTACLSAALAPLCIATGVVAQSPETVDEVVVTGSRMAGSGRLAPIETISRDAMAAGSVTDASQLVGLMTANSGSESRIDQLNQPQSSGTAQFNLRNLGLGSTLVLVDGHRWTNSAVTATDGTAFVDINSLVPLIALERVEVVKDGASAVYGSDAVAGVVNFITRRNVGTPELNSTYGFADGSDETLVEAIGGLELFGGDMILAGSRFHRSALGSDERTFTQAETYGLAPWTAVTSYGQPGSYYRPGRQAFTPDPDCENPAFPKAYRTGPNDSFCRLDYSDFFDLAPEETRTQIFADYRRPIGQVELWLQGAWSSTYTRARQSPSLPILAQALSVPASHPDNPFGETVQFRGRLLGAEAGASAADFNYRTWRVAGGLSGSLAGGWAWDVVATTSRQDVRYDKPDVIGSALQNALNGLGGADCNPATGRPGVGPCQYFNPFGSAFLGTGTPNSPTLVASLIGSTGLRGAADAVTVDAQIGGRAFMTGQVTADVVMGVQYRQNGLRHDWSDLVNRGDLLTAGYSPDFDGDQQALAAFAEARIRLHDRVEAQLAARYEASDRGKGELSPRIAFHWDVADALKVRGSWSQGFRTPSVYTLRGAQASQPSVFDRGAFVFVNTLASGDPDLQSETSDSVSLGAVWRPLNGLELTVDAWRFDYANLVVKEQAQPIIDQAAADDAAGLIGTPAQRRIIRSDGGTLKSVQLYFINASEIRSDGLDVSARYSRHMFGGQATISATWTYVDRYDIRLKADSPVVSGVGSTNLSNIGRSLPRNRGEAGLTWRDDRNRLTTLVHYTSAYRNDRAGITDADIDNQTTLDVHYTRAIGPDLDISLGVVNIADAEPPLAQFALGYDPVVADPRGRVVNLSISKRF